MQNFLFFWLSLFVFMFYSSLSTAQDCPNNSAVQPPEYFFGEGDPFPDLEAACDSAFANTSNSGITIHSFNSSTYQCHLTQTSPHYNTYRLSAGTIGGGTECSCSSNQIASTDSSGSVTGCSDIADVPNSGDCQDSIDAYLGKCGSAPDDCKNSSGDFGFVNSNPSGGGSNQAVCVPSDYSGGGNASDTDCSDQQTLYLGNGGASPSCVDNTIPKGCANDNDCDGTTDSEDQTPNGDGISSGQGGSPSSTGGTRTDPDTGEQIIDPETGTTVSCNPLNDANCDPNGQNSGAGQCDPESFNYLSCLIKKPKKGNVITKLNLTGVQTDIVNAQSELTTLLGQIKTEFSASVGSVSDGTARLPSVVKNVRGQDVEFGFVKFDADISIIRNIFLIVCAMVAVGIVLRGRSDG
jgi:hypothetical protein